MICTIRYCPYKKYKQKALSKNDYEIDKMCQDLIDKLKKEY